MATGTATPAGATARQPNPEGAPEADRPAGCRFAGRSGVAYSSAGAQPVKK